MKLFDVMDTAFDNYDETVRRYLTKTFTGLGMQYTHSQVFGVIFDGLKGIMENAMFYIEDALTEQNIFTCTRKQSVYSLAKLSGYEPYYGAAPTGTLIAKLVVSNDLESKTTKIYIPNHTQVTNNVTNLSYSIVLPTDFYVVDIAKPLMVHEFKIVQGYFDTATYVAAGYNWENVNVNTSELFDRQYLTVTVDGEQWEEASNMYDMVENGKQYLITVGFDNSFDIMFGNGTYGKRLSEGQTVEITYLKHLGTLGNIAPNAYTEFVFSEKLYDTLGNYVEANEYITLDMSTCVSGGTNSDSASFIRSMIGFNSRSLVLASEDNFRLFFKRFSFIGYVNCWSEENTMCIVASCMRNIEDEITSVDDYYNLDTTSLTLTDEQKEMIQTTLDNSKKSFAGVTLKFQDPVPRRFAIICYVKVDNVYNRDAATTSIKSTLANYFMSKFEDTQFIPKSDLIKEILDNDSTIQSVDIDIISELAEQTYYYGSYEKYEMKLVNGVYQYQTRKIMYEPQSTPGMDYYGNISLDSKLEVPILQGSFKYYPNKDDYNKRDCIQMETVQVYFI